jgi:hypothetical protein
LLEIGQGIGQGIENAGGLRPGVGGQCVLESLHLRLLRVEERRQSGQLLPPLLGRCTQDQLRRPLGGGLGLLQRGRHVFRRTQGHQRLDL